MNKWFMAFRFNSFPYVFFARSVFVTITLTIRIYFVWFSSHIRTHSRCHSVWHIWFTIKLCHALWLSSFVEYFYIVTQSVRSPFLLYFLIRIHFFQLATIHDRQLVGFVLKLTTLKVQGMYTILSHFTQVECVLLPVYAKCDRIASNYFTFLE